MVRLLLHWTDAARRFAWAVIVGAIIATGFIAVYTANNLKMQTDTTEMLSSKLEWRKLNSRFDKALPDLRRNIVIVVTAPNPDLARDGAAALAKKLAAAQNVFNFVFFPPEEPYFKKNGLLLLETEEVDALSARLAEAQPLLASLAGDMSLRGLFGILADAGDEISKGSSKEMPQFARVLDRVAGVIESIGDKSPKSLSWLELLGSGNAKPSDSRQIILAQPNPDFGSLSPAEEAISLIRKFARDLKLDPDHGYSVHLTGGLSIQEEEFQSVKETAGLAGLISFVLVGLVIFAGLRSGRLVFATLAVLLVGLIWTAGFATLAIGYLNLISVAFAVLFLGLSVDYGIQYGLRYREEVDRGVSNEAALREAGAGVGRAVCLSALTSAIGFFAFVPTAYVGMAELGIIAGTGIFIAVFLYLTLLPAILSVYPLRRRTAPGRGRLFETVGGWLVARPRTVVIIGALLAIGGLATIPLLKFELDPIQLTDGSTESVRTFLELAQDAESSPYTIGILVPDDVAAKRVAAQLSKLSVVDRVTTAASYVPSDQEAKLDIIGGMGLFLSPVFEPPAPPRPATDVERRKVIERLRGSLTKLATASTTGNLSTSAGRLRKALDRLDGASAASLKGLERALLSSLPNRLSELETALDAGPVTQKDLPRVVKRRLFTADGEQLVSVHPTEDVSDPAALRRFVNAVSDVAPGATDRPVVILRAGESVIQAFKEAGAIAALLIIFVLILILRNIVEAALVLGPVVLAATLSLAATVVFDIPFNFANVIAIPLLMALGVDFGIHLILRYRETGGNLAELLASSTPRAVFYSGLTTMCSFGSLVVSDHRGTASMGWLLLISISLGLICALVVLPALLRWRRSDENPG